MSAILQGLWQAGFASEMVSTEQILSDGLNHFKVLILCNSESIGDGEAAKIEAFVKAGGLVIADMRPGVADEHGRLRPSAAMARLFGVQWTYPLAVASDPQTGHYAGAYQGTSFAAPGDWTMEPSLMTIGSAQLLKSPEGVPLMTVNHYGQGTAIYGVPFCPKGDPPFIGNLLQAILAAHGIRPWATVHDREPGYEPGTFLPELKCTRLLDGRICYAGLVRTRQFKPSDARPGQLTVAFPAKGHVYNVREGTYLGEREQLDIQLPPSGCRLLASLPYKVEALTILSDRADFACGGTIRGHLVLRAGAPVSERHVVHVEVMRPDGRTVRRLGCNVDLKNGQGSFAIPLVLNELHGAWTLAARDAASGVKAALQVTVK